jgi:hypothetical protein
LAFSIYFLAVAFPIPLIFNFTKSSILTLASFSIESIPAAFILSAVAFPMPLTFSVKI